MRSCVLAFVVVCLFGPSVPAASAQPLVEVGSSLTSLVFQTDKHSNTTTFGVPSATLGLTDPGVYASFFIGPNAAVEPRVGLFWQSSAGFSNHVITAGAQFDYMFAGTAKASPFLFAGAGISDTGSSVSPKYVSVGGGMRLPAGDRLAFRLDAHYTHYTDDNGNGVTIGFSIGGVFHRR